MTDKAYILKFWYDALIDSSRQGAEGFTGFAGEDALMQAKLKVLWRLHSGTYLNVFMHDGERYADWETCEKLSKLIIDKAVADAMSGEWTDDEAAELKEFRGKCDAGAYDVSELKPLLHAIFHDADEETSQKIDEEIQRRKDFARWALYSSKDARKEEVMEPYRSKSDEPPPGMDEFEYIDWVISH